MFKLIDGHLNFLENLIKFIVCIHYTYGVFRYVKVQRYLSKLHTLIVSNDNIGSNDLLW